MRIFEKATTALEVKPRSPLFDIALMLQNKSSESRD